MADIVKNSMFLSSGAALVVSVVSHGHASMLCELLADMAAAQSPIAQLIITANLKAEPLGALQALANQLPWPTVFIHNARPKGFGANHNQAFFSQPRRAQDVFVVLNPDVRWANGADPLRALADALRPGVAVAAPQVMSASGNLEDSWRLALTPAQLFKRYALGERVAATEQSAQWAAGMCLAFSAVAYQQLKGFDEGFFMYCEDMDIGLRVSDLGLKTAYCSDVQVIHAAQRASRKSLRHLAWHSMSLLRFWVKRGAASMRRTSA